MIINEEVYLEHFGVKGMKWGVRREKSETQSNTDQTPKKDNSSRNKKIAAGVAVAAGAIAVAAILKRSGGVDIKSLSELPATARDVMSVGKRAPKARETNAHQGGTVQQNHKTLVEAGKAALKEIMNRRSQTKIIDIPSREIFTPKSKSFFEKNMPTFRKLVKG